MYKYSAICYGYVCAMRRKWKWTVQTFFSYKFMRLVTIFEMLKRETSNNTHTHPVMKRHITKNKDEIPSEIIWNDEHALYVRMHCVCKVDVEHWTVRSISVFKKENFLYGWSQEIRLNMRLVYDSIFFSFYILFSAHINRLIMCI